jgi:DNA-binding transcriptional ArsR family regulator
MKVSEMESNAQEASKLLKSLANPNRLIVLCHLSKEECTVGELEKRVNLSQSALSQHLARLREEEIVEYRREAQSIFYSVKDEKTRSLLSSLYELYCND